MHLAFNRYNVGELPKTSTHERRLFGNNHVAHDIIYTTSIVRVSLGNLLSHIKKKRRTHNISRSNLLQHALRNEINVVVVAWSNHAEATRRQCNVSSSQYDATSNRGYISQDPFSRYWSSCASCNTLSKYLPRHMLCGRNYLGCTATCTFESTCYNLEQ